MQSGPRCLAPPVGRRWRTAPQKTGTRGLLGALVLATLLWLPLQAQDDGVYIVAPGDTLGVIAARFGIPLDLLTQVNEIDDPNRITVGQRLLIPTADGQLPLAAIPTAVRRAEPGDTLFTFSARYGQAVQLLADLNNLDSATRLFPGQSLRVPEEGLPATAPLRFGAVTAVSAPAAIIQGRTGRVVVTTDRPAGIARRLARPGACLYATGRRWLAAVCAAPRTGAPGSWRLRSCRRLHDSTGPARRREMVRDGGGR